jgi:HK97 family phage portal protein
MAARGDWWGPLAARLGRWAAAPLVLTARGLRTLTGATLKQLGVPFPGTSAGGVVYDVYPSGGPWWDRWRRAAPNAPEGSSIVMAAVGWVGRTLPEAPLRVYQRTPEGDEVVFDHALELLLEQPNEYYAGPLLWQATLTDYLVGGNAYWLKVRDGRGAVVELWWLPAQFLEPRWDSAEDYLTHYDYRPAGETLRIERADVVHFRYGLDPDNPRKGRSPLACVLSEVLTDAEAAQYTQTILHNTGIPGVVISPDETQALTDAELEQVKATFTERFTGSRRGEPLVLTAKTKVDRLSFSPTEMNLRELRKLPEERILAALGIPPIVVGVGAGLDRSTFANFAEAREAAFESMVVPLQRAIAAEVQLQLLPDFTGAAPTRTGRSRSRLRCAFDTSNVRVLQEDQDALVNRLAVAVASSLITPNEARSKMGLPPAADDQGDLRLQRSSLQPVPEVEAAAPPSPAPAAPSASPAADGGDGGLALPGPGDGLPGDALLSAGAMKALPENFARWMNGAAVGAGPLPQGGED